MIELRNRQKTKRLNTRLLRRIATHIIREELRAPEYDLCFHLIDAGEMARINEQFLQHHGSTDVITFDYSDPQHAQSGSLHGEAFVSIPDAVTQAKEFRTTWQSEVVRYVIHALLHLRGYDDLNPAARRVMKSEENRLMKIVEREFALKSIESV